MSPDRAEAMQEFLAGAGWRDAAITPLPGDASTRRYFRVALGGRKAMLMDQPQNAETPACPPGASPEQRHALGYNAVARLAGADCARFVAVAQFLRAQGLSAPEIYAAAPDGFVLMEDLEGDLYADFIPRNGNEFELILRPSKLWRNCMSAKHRETFISKSHFIPTMKPHCSPKPIF